MCLALPGKLISKEGAQGQMELGGNRFKVWLTLLPEAEVGNWILVHAGYGLTIVDEDHAREVWELVSDIQAGQDQEDQQDQQVQ